MYDLREEVLHPGHRSIRLQGHDYSSPGFYFATICVQNQRCIFGKVVGAQVDLNKLGQTVRECWVAIPLHFPRTNLHGFVIMPNHVHGILEIVRRTGAQPASPLQTGAINAKIGRGSLGATIRSFKAAVTKRARGELRWSGELWQRNYFERVLRDGKEFADASRYVDENPLKCELDQDNPDMRQVQTGELIGAQHAAPLRRGPT